ncbi:gustatory receptor for sugar taste 64a isoform X2 [Drosophila pseudoobscura]|uniref:Gustatory receptor n=1 Tax=Drosophila pseudoobscura pseudoobscura TaxID=46245 RepID=A0A6I8WCF2_DROPS|nr:gustatory receptor for sugar taste 64a isoform X2 [Drosophila pseudoobscura]
MEGPALNARKTGPKRRHESLLRTLAQPANTVPKLADKTHLEFNVITSEKLPEYARLDIFHRAVYPFMFLAQCFAVMPLTGIREPNPRRVRFTYKSLPMVVTLTFIAAALMMELAMLKHLLQIGINAKNFGLVFFGCVLLACVVFIRLARRWPPLIRYWTRTELVFTRAPYEMPKRNLYRRVQLAGMMIIGLSLGEHAMYQVSAILSYKRRVNLCSAAANITAVTSFEDYITLNYDYVFQWLPYSPIIASLILLINGACTFVWNYMDLFIMMVSKGLAYRFEQITARIRKLEHEEVAESTFIEIREHYVKMCELLEYVDSSMSSLILLSCVNNLYFVCYQLLNVFNKLRWPINYVYFWYSLLYLIGRTAFVFLTAADINEESKRGLGVLRRVSSKSWCVEVERLIFQMTTQTVALSGKKFYFLTRRLLFGMAGTIVTYELVLLQFDEPNRRKGLLPLCA